MLLVALLCLVVWPAPSDSTGSVLDRQIITAEMIREAGLVRPNDLFRLMEGWAFASIDGFHVQAPGGLVAPMPNGWSVWVDGHHVPTTLTGTHDLNVLPVSLHDIDYVEVYSAPVIFGGAFAGQGLIHIHTKRQDGGLGARAAYWQGNESGDPGPFRYQGRTANVDKLGPDLSASVSYGTTTFQARVSGVSRDHHPTDPAILPRIQALAREYPNTVYAGVSGLAALEGKWGRQSASVLYSDVEDYLWLRPYGYEIPAEQGYLSGSFRGELSVGSRFYIHHALEYSASRLGERANLIGVNPDWRHEIGVARLELERKARALSGAFGVRLERERVQSRYLREDVLATHPSVYAHVKGGWEKPLAYDLSVQADLGRESPTWSVAASSEYGVGARHLIYVAGTYGRQPLSAVQPLWNLTFEGYSFLDSLGVRYRLRGVASAHRQASADLRWRYSAGRAFGLDAGVQYRWTDGLLVEQQQLGADPAGPVFVGPVDLDAGAQGHTAGVHAGVRSGVLPQVSQHSTVAIRMVTRGDAAFEEAWARWPAVQAQTSWTYAPALSFNLNVRLSYRSGTEWASGNPSSHAIRLAVPGAFTVDVAMQKWLWERRIRGSVVVRNATNRRHRYHPRGETNDLSLLLHLSVLLND